MDRLVSALPTELDVLFYCFISAFAAAALLVPLIGSIAHRIGWVDRPGGIKTHARIIPYGGGLGIAFATFVGLTLFHPDEVAPDYAQGFFAASFLIFLGGIWDDLRPMGFMGKFTIQGLAAAIVISDGIQLDVKLLSPWANHLLTALWLIGITNAVNIIDVMDGLAGGVCGIVAATFGLIGLLFSNEPAAYLGFVLSGGIGGFLLYNFHPARIFMGDAGAQLLGFILGVLAILGAYTSFNKIALLAPVVALGIPIFDTVLVTLLRIRKGVSPFMGSPDHFALRLRAIGFSVPATVRIVLLTTFVLSAAALFATLVPLEEALIIYGVTLASAVAAGFFLARAKIG